MSNIILATDSYKHSHFLQYPPGAQHVSSYIEARVGADHEQITQFFGLQAFLVEYLSSSITEGDIDEAEEILVKHGLPFNRAGWEYILDKHSGYLPLTIEALPEGIVVPRGTPLVQVHNTDPNVPWLTSFIETALLRAIWYPSSVATLGFLTKAIIYDGLVTSSDDPAVGLPFKLHDFGARGVSSGGSAGLGGMAHLVNFWGTDTLEAIQAVYAFYGSNTMPGLSIPASEHSTMTSWGKEGEADAYANMMDKFGSGLFSIVSDSYDLFGAIQNIYGGTLKEKIENLEGKLIVRPDSGDPILTPLQVLIELWDIFGGTVNSKGFKVLNPKVGVIQGDGMDAHKIALLVKACLEAGFSIDNIAFGMGGGLLQGHMRDDMRFAMKANAIDFGDGWIDVQKKPATDPSKASKAGRVAVLRRDDDSLAVRREDELTDDELERNLLEPVYSDGHLLREVSFEAVRVRATAELVRFHERVFAEPEQAAAAE